MTGQGGRRAGEDEDGAGAAGDEGAGAEGAEAGGEHSGQGQGCAGEDSEGPGDLLIISWTSCEPGARQLS